MLDLILWIFVFFASLFILIKASDYFVDSSEKIGRYFGLPAFIIGVLIVSIGTSLPELISSIFAVLKNTSEIVVANVIGSNIANIFLVFGCVGIIGKKLRIDYDILNVDMPLLIGSAILLAFMLFDGNYSVFEIILSLLYISAYFIYTVKSNTISKDKQIKKEVSGFVEKITKKELLHTLGYFVLSILFIYFGAKYTVDAVINLSTILNISSGLIAISAVAIGTSLPELIVSVEAARKGKPEIAIGNILGSNIFNSFAVMAIPAFFGKLVIPTNIIMFAIPMMVAGTILYFFIVQDKKVTYVEGWLLIIFYLFFLGYLFGLV